MYVGPGVAAYMKRCRLTEKATQFDHQRAHGIAFSDHEDLNQNLVASIVLKYVSTKAIIYSMGYKPKRGPRDWFSCMQDGMYSILDALGETWSTWG
jgi:hypothetical protein